MKKFVNPELDVLKFAVEDIITTSGNEVGEGGDEYETPLG